ncbi:MAG: site-specific integrase [Muribaculum sp.]|nr:site-specific integrase [Muribaculum sp.]
MGKSLTGKELGQGITQRKDGRYQARFTNRFGKRRTIYAKTLQEIRRRLREEQYEDEKKMNPASGDITLDEWFEIWMDTCKKNCRNTTKTNYTHAYNRIRESLGWRKLSGIHLITMQQAFNELKSDVSRKDTRRVLVDMYNKAMDADLVTKNIPRQINTVVTGTPAGTPAGMPTGISAGNADRECRPKEPRVLTPKETTLFLEAAQHYRYANVFRLALETGMRIGELLGLQWADIDWDNRTIRVNRTLVYVKCRDEKSANYGRKINEFHAPKTERGKRRIPMTAEACRILQDQKAYKARIQERGRRAPEGFEDLVFVTTRNTPVSQTDADLVMQLISRRIAERHEGFRPLTPHTLRHTFATRCIERGMNPKTVQVLLGHSSINITMNLYCHVTEDTLLAEMKKFEERS